jgi:hypothetical protein
MAPVTGGDAELGYMLASCAWVNDRPDCERKELVRPTEPEWAILGLDCRVGLGPCGTTAGEVRRYDVDGEAEVNGCIE